MVSLQSNSNTNIDRWPVSTDIIETLNALQDMNEERSQNSQVIFYPAQYARENIITSLAEYELDESVLREWLIDGSLIRSKFRVLSTIYGRTSGVNMVK